MILRRKVTLKSEDDVPIVRNNQVSLQDISSSDSENDVPCCYSSVHKYYNWLWGQCGSAFSIVGSEFKGLKTFFGRETEHGRSVEYKQPIFFLHQLTTSISVFECPMLHTMHPFFSLSKWWRATTFLLPRKQRDNKQSSNHENYN